LASVVVVVEVLVEVLAAGVVLDVVELARDEIVAAVVGVVAELPGPELTPAEHDARNAAIRPTVTGNRREASRGRESGDTGVDRLFIETGKQLRARRGAAVKTVAGKTNTCSLH
jgi:hypothetical protein